MWRTNRGVPLTGQLGEMLAKPLNGVSRGGEVCGLSVSSLPQVGGSRVVCQWCANDSEQVVSLDLTQLTAYAGFIRLAVITISLGACSSCSSVLTQSLTDAGKRQSAR